MYAKKVTGEPRETETLMRRFGEGPLEKYPQGQLAGGLLYTHESFGGGLLEKCSVVRVTRWLPTLLHASF